MIFAIIKDGKVENVIDASLEFAESLGLEFVDVTDVENGPSPGWGYDGENFIDPSPPRPPSAEELARAQKISELKALAQDQTKIPIQGPELQALLKKLIEAVL